MLTILLNPAFFRQPSVTPGYNQISPSTAGIRRAPVSTPSQIPAGAAAQARIIPLQAVPNQALTVQLNGQNCQINVRQRRTGLFMDVLVSNRLIIAGVVCENANRIMRSRYLGFQGDFIFIDRQGASDPDYTGLGGRYQLIYLPQSVLPAYAG